MPLSRRRLAAGEEVLIDVRPHWSRLAGPVATLAGVIAGAIAALVVGVPAWTEWPILAALAGSVLWLVLRYLRWATTRLLLTNSRIIERRGVLARVSREIPLSALSEISLRRSLLERMIGTGDLMLESAGRDGSEVFTALPHPAVIRDELYAQMAEWRRGPGPGPLAYAARTYGQPGYPGPETIPAQIEQLDRLRRQGAITEEEFALKKAQLLDRL